jgi:RNA polymerase sigma factor (sigma-70 family)
VTRRADNERSGATAVHDRSARDHVALLVARATDGDRAAWNALVDEFGGLVWATTRVHGLGAAQASDVVQSTWMHLVENLKSLEDPARLGVWLAMTARRESLKVIRRSRRAISRSDDLPRLPSDAPASAEWLASEQNAVAVQAALQRLGPRDRALLRMLALDPTPRDAEIGAALGIAIDSIGPMRTRALTRLRRQGAPRRLTARDLSG